MRRLRGAIIASVISHVVALAWLAHDGRVLAVPLRDRATAASPSPTLPSSEELTVVLFDDRARPGEPAGAPSPRSSPLPTATTTSTASTAATTASITATTTAPARERPGTSPSSGDAGATSPGPARSSWMTMRPHDRPSQNDLSDDFVARFLEHSRPLAPAPDIPWERLTEQIAELRRTHRGSLEQIVALNQQLADEELKPSGRGTYRASKETFTATVDADGTTHLEDRPERLDSQDAFMLRHGIDPYARNKLAFLDRTRDQRAAVGERHRRVQLSHAPQLMQRNIDRLWATTPDLAARKSGLFELWDDCAETGSDEVIAGGTAARALVIGVIRARLRGASAYTAAELAELNARRRSAARFVPYES
jgi:hypothetical protein